MSYDNGITFDSLGHTPGQVDYVNVIDRDGNPIAYTIPRWKANFDYKRRYSPAIAAMMDCWDGGDMWGSAIAMAFAVAEVADAVDYDEPGQILDYRPSPVKSELSLDELVDHDETSIETTELGEAVQDGRVTNDDLKFAARVLNRYLAILDRAGQSY